MRIRVTALIFSCAVAIAGCAAGDESEDLAFRGTDHATETGEPTTGDKETEDTGAVEEAGEEEETGGGEGCTRTIGYWRNHSAEATNPSQQIAWPISENTTICSTTWLDLLNTAPRGGNAFIILARQWIAAQLNVAAGADASAAIDDAIAEAGDLLAGCSISADMRDEALELATLLDDFNNGLEGVESCD
jgi:hypothetical protein